MDELAESVKANLDQAEANLDRIALGWGAIGANTNLVKSARWRLVRNARLLRESRALLAENRRLLHENDGLFAKNAVLLAIRRRAAL